jgi:hypothetical protein
MLRWTISVSLYVVCCDCISLLKITFFLRTNWTLSLSVYLLSDAYITNWCLQLCNPSCLILDHCLVWCINVSTLAKKNPSLVFSCPYYSYQFLRFALFGSIMQHSANTMWFKFWLVPHFQAYLVWLGFQARMESVKV